MAALAGSDLFHDSDYEIVKPTSFLDLPAELVQHILSFLGPEDLANASQTCRHLHAGSYDDQLWQPMVNHNLPYPISTPGPAKSFRDLFIAHRLHWFLAKHRFWFGDSEPSGKLVVTRYNETTGSIEAYTVAAKRGHHTLAFWEMDREVIIHSFNPIVSLDLHQPVLKLSIDSPEAEHPPNNDPSDRAYAPESEYSKEILMDTFSESGLYSSFMLCRTLPESAIAENTQVWPPLRFPSNTRARNDSYDRFSSAGHRPTRYSEVSQSNFRLRKWVEYTGRRTSPSLVSFNAGGGLSAALGFSMPYFASGLGAAGAGMTIRTPEDITTYGTLPESCYTPTPRKPWQGIWCGDYSGHGCEFLVITQPDKKDERPLPSGMDFLQYWLRGHRRGSESSTTSFVSAMEDFDDEDPEAAAEGSVPNAAAEDKSKRSSDDEQTDCANDVPTGRIEAIKLTGDPNIPRGEYTFIAPDIGHGGFVRIADEIPFRGARIVRSAGHVAGRGFRHGEHGEQPYPSLFVCGGFGY